MYNLRLVHYEVPRLGEKSIERVGNFYGVCSAVRAIYHALNARAPQFDVVVEGLNPKNLRSVPLRVSGDSVDLNSGEVSRRPFAYERKENLGKKIDLPTLFYVLDTLLEDNVTTQLQKEGTPLLDNLHLDIDGTGKLDQWLLRMYSKAAMYELHIATKSPFFGRSVTMNVEIDETTADAEDLRAIVEVGTVLSDHQFRTDGRYEKYVKYKKGKDHARFEVFSLGEADTPLSSSMKSILEDELKAELPEKLTQENFSVCMPKYLVLADRLHQEVKEVQTSLTTALARHQSYVQMLSEESPQLEKILDIKTEHDPEIERKSREQIVRMDKEKYHLIKSENMSHQRIGEQLLLGRALMERRLQILSSYHGSMKKLEESGIIAAEVFDQTEFFERIANYQTVEIAAQARALLRAGGQDE